MEQSPNPTTQPTDPTPPPRPPTPTPPQPLPSLPPPSSSTATQGIPSPNPSPNPNPNPPTPKPSLTSPPPQQPQHQQQQTSQTRPPFNRTWPQQSNFPQFSSAASTPSVPANPSPPQPQRGGMAIGVPAHHPGPSPSPPTGSFSSLSASPFGQQFGGLGRNSSESMGTSQARQSMQGVHGMGMMSSPLGSGSQMRPSGISGQHPQRPQQSSLRPQITSSNPSAAPQSFTGHGLLRVPGSVGTPSPSTSQGAQSHNQPWLSSGSQGKPPLPSPLYRPQINTQQRSHISQQQHHHPLSASKQQQPMTSVQRPQPSLPSHVPQEQFGQQHPPSRAPQSLPHQQQAMRGQLSGNQKSSTLGIVQPSPVQIGPNNRPDSTEATEAGGKIVSKRSIHDLVTQIDPSERLELDPEVEDILVDIAEDFVDTITTFGCSLANHRKSNILEAKDILLHLERNWNLTLPGFGGDEIKTYKRPAVNDIHRERLAAIKKSMIGTDFANTKNPAGQSTANTKVHIVKASANAISQDT